jgi:hypothetical protein
MCIEAHRQAGVLVPDPSRDDRDRYASEMLSSGSLRSVKIGRRRLVPESAIVELIRRLEAGEAA